MNELTDLELCKQIASIEGETIEHITKEGALFVSSNEHEPYSPLTDDALCFRLMVKYEVQLYAEDPGFNVAQCNSWAELYPRHSSVNRAICLAIIEAHKC